MLELTLTPEEQEEAALVKKIYRTKHMCSMGPVFEATFKKNRDAFENEMEFLHLCEGFLNHTYFNDDRNSGLPQNTQELTGFRVWQAPCKITDLRNGIEPGIFLGRYHGRVQLEMNRLGSGILDEGLACEAMSKEPGVHSSTILSFPYTAEVVLTTYEQIFMLLRSFWYFLEAQVLESLLRNDTHAGLKELFSAYTHVRRNVIDAFFLDAFPETHYYTKLDHLTSPGLSQVYDKYMFSQLRHTQKKSLLLAGLIRREIENRT